MKKFTMKKNAPAYETTLLTFSHVGIIISVLLYTLSAANVLINESDNESKLTVQVPNQPAEVVDNNQSFQHEKLCSTIVILKHTLDSIRHVMPSLLNLYHIAFKQQNDELKNELMVACKEINDFLSAMNNNIAVITYEFDSYAYTNSSRLPYGLRDMYMHCNKSEPSYEDVMYCMHLEFLVSASQLEELTSYLFYFLDLFQFQYRFAHNNKNIDTLTSELEKANSSFRSHYTVFSSLNLWQLYYELKASM